MCRSGDATAAVVKKEKEGNGDGLAVIPATSQHEVYGAGKMKTIVTMIYCHFSVALLCLNVLFDLVVLGLPVFVLYRLHVLSPATYHHLTSLVIEWTTPVVYFMPMMLSGSTIYCNDIDLIIESKALDSLLLANQASRIDWMVAMFIGHVSEIGGRQCSRIRVGFVCEAFVQFLPIVGWYRHVVASDIFIWTTFKHEATTIRRNIRLFHESRVPRMLFLSPEGVVVDFGQRDLQYIEDCRRFCQNLRRAPYEYVLTPRYKGTTNLLEQVRRGGGPVVSICIAYVRDGKLLNCRLLSPDREVPDIFSLNQGIASSPFDVYIHCKRLPAPKMAGSSEQVLHTKQILLDDYARKDKLLARWEKEIESGAMGKGFKAIEGNYLEALLFQVAHAVVIGGSAVLLGCTRALFGVFTYLFVTILLCHSTSTKSVPFESTIKRMISSILSRMEKKD